jgi:uncharacterized protein (DUF305 family)
MSRAPDHDPSEPESDPEDDRLGVARRLLAALTPQGPLQVAAGVLALCFLAGCVGYLVGTRQSPVPTSAVDQGFLIDMSDHHDQAVTMALCAVSRAPDQIVQSLAQEILIFQNRELATMTDFLADQGVARPTGEDREAMAWMGMGTPVASMPGMATPEQVDTLCKTTGNDLNIMFLRLMRTHHLGGAHMADYAAEHAAAPGLRTYAAAMARNQRIEADEFTKSLQRLGGG